MARCEECNVNVAFYQAPLDGKTVQLCEICFNKDYFQCHKTGQSCHKKDGIRIEQYEREYLRHIYVSKANASSYRFKCGVSSKLFFVSKPIVVFRESDSSRFNISPESYRKLKKSGELSHCKGCANWTIFNRGDKVRAEIAKFYKKYPDNAPDLFHGNTHDMCLSCTSNVFPLRYDSVRDIFSGPPKNLFDGPTPVGRTVGIEIECEPTPLSQVIMAGWRQTDKGVPLVQGTTDGSLRGRYSVEYISPILDSISMDEWYDEFARRIDGVAYDRCGAHIHVGADDLSWFDLMILCKWCKIHENDILGMVTVGRILLEPDPTGRPALLPATWARMNHKSKSEFFQFLYGKDREGINMREVKESKRANDQSGPRYNGAIHRYYWLNIHPWWHGNKHGPRKRAVEIRLHPGSIDTKVKMKYWSKYWMSVLDSVKKHGANILNKKPLDLCSHDVAMYYRKRIKELTDRAGEIGHEAGKPVKMDYSSGGVDLPSADGSRRSRVSRQISEQLAAIVDREEDPPMPTWSGGVEPAFLEDDEPEPTVW